MNVNTYPCYNQTEVQTFVNTMCTYLLIFTIEYCQPLHRLAENGWIPARNMNVSSAPAVSRPDIWFVQPPLQCILAGTLPGEMVAKVGSYTDTPPYMLKV